jgi:hypothetical protein
MEPLWQVTGSTVSIVDKEITTIPEELSQFAEECTELTITFCLLKYACSNFSVDSRL